MNVPNDSNYVVRIDGQGSIELRGTNQFVQAHTAYLTEVVGVSLRAWHDKQIADGRDPADVKAELAAALDRAEAQFRDGVRPIEVKAGA